MENNLTIDKWLNQHWKITIENGLKNNKKGLLNVKNILKIGEK